MNYNLVDSTLYKEEGERLDVYLDDTLHPTVGKGHLVRPEDNLKVGDIITQAQSDAFYVQDRNNAIAAAGRIFPDFNTFPDTAQVGIVSLIYNVGEGEFSTWNNTKAMINSHDWKKVSDYLSSAVFDKYRHQVGTRLSEIVDLFKSAGAGGVAVGILFLGAIGFTIYKLVQHHNGNLT